MKREVNKGKHWCEVCRIEIPSTSTSIMMHEKSAKHLATRASLLESGGRREKSDWRKYVEKFEDLRNPENSRA